MRHFLWKYIAWLCGALLKFSKQYRSFFLKSYTLTLDCQLNASTPLYKTREVSEGRRGMNGGFIAPQFMLCGHGVSCTNRSQCCFLLRCILLQFSTLSCWFVFVFKSLFFSYFAFGPFGRRPLVLCRQKNAIKWIQRKRVYFVEREHFIQSTKDLCVWSLS